MMPSNPTSLQLANPMHDIITHERAGMVSENRQQESIRHLLQCSMFDYYGLGHFPKLHSHTLCKSTSGSSGHNKSVTKLLQILHFVPYPATLSHHLIGE